MATTFATPNADSLRVLGAKVLGRGPTRPHSIDALNATHTANTAHTGNQNAVICASIPRNAEPPKNAVATERMESRLGMTALP